MSQHGEFGHGESGQAESGQRGVQEQDPAERLAVALRRIAVAVERREAASGPRGPAGLAPVAGDLDALIGRLRSVLDNVSHGSS